MLHDIGPDDRELLERAREHVLATDEELARLVVRLGHVEAGHYPAPQQAVHYCTDRMNTLRARMQASSDLLCEFLGRVEPEPSPAAPAAGARA